MDNIFNTGLHEKYNLFESNVKLNNGDKCKIKLMDN